MLGAVVATLVVAAPAQAGDAGLRKVVTQQERKRAPLTEDFAIAIETPTSAVGIEQLTAALKALRSATNQERAAVVRIKAISAKVKRGRTLLLIALAGESTALATYGDGLQQVFDEQLSAAKRTFAKGATQLKAATRKTGAAKKLIGVQG